MANGDAVESMRAKLAACAERPARVIVHLNLSEGPSTLPPHRVPLLVDGEGAFKYGFGSLGVAWLKGSAAFRRALIEQVESEWQAQIARVHDMVAPRSLEGVDGHVHLHMLPFLFPVAARLARRNGISGIRISREPFFLAGGLRDLLSPAILVNLFKHVVLRLCARRAHDIVRDAGLIASSFVIGVLYSGRMTAAAASAGLAAAQRCGARSVEIFFHVGRARDGERTRWGHRRGFIAFNCSPRRDREFAELAAFHGDLVKAGLRR